MNDSFTAVTIIQQQMILTSQLIHSCPHFINEHNETELDLRGKGIKEINNTEATVNYFQCIDLSDNNIEILNNFSYLDRVRTLIVSNNKVRMIYGISQNLPNLQNLFLMGNKISELSELLSLRNCKHLKRLILVNNPISKKAEYRRFAIFHIKSLTVLDFKTITAKQRKQAQLFYAK